MAHGRDFQVTIDSCNCSKGCSNKERYMDWRREGRGDIHFEESHGWRFISVCVTIRRKRNSRLAVEVTYEHSVVFERPMLSTIRFSLKYGRYSRPDDSPQTSTNNTRANTRKQNFPMGKSNLKSEPGLLISIIVPIRNWRGYDSVGFSIPINTRSFWHLPILRVFHDMLELFGLRA